MSAPSSPREPAPIRELRVVVVWTLVGGMLRLWSPGRLGLVHFDEGIYALAGLWVFSPHGLRDLDPTVIAYAPPGFPFLVGAAYWFLGAGDLSAILVSIIAGTLTIPAVGWLASRTFGHGAGAAAAAFVALSGPHLAFSRMALTDASFLLVWIIAIGQGQRFLERPHFPRAVALGFSIGVAQLFKYNGWIAGALVVLSAALLGVFRREERTRMNLLTTWGWGCFAALIAALVYWPWYRFVESHGGYAALLAHHRGYLGGLAAWPGHLGVQLAESRALSGGPAWQLVAGLAAAVGMWTVWGGPGGRRGMPRGLLSGFLATLNAAGLLGWIFAVSAAWIMLGPSRGRTNSRALVRVGAIILLLLTPFYHPYARLWLPIEAFGWVLLGGGYIAIGSPSPQRSWGPDPVAPESPTAMRRPIPDPIVALGAVCVLAFVLRLDPANWSQEIQIGTLLQPTDSLRGACRAIAHDLPAGLKTLRLYARPPVTFYLAGRTPLSPQPDLDRLLAPADARSWALLDLAMTRQANRSLEGLAPLHDRWTIVRAVPTALNLPTLLDIDPSAATIGKWDASAPLLLLRPGRPGEVR